MEGRFRWAGEDGLRYWLRWDGTDSGLLAAVDEATGRSDAGADWPADRVQDRKLDGRRGADAAMPSEVVALMDEWNHCRDHGIDYLNRKNGCPLCVAEYEITRLRTALAEAQRENEELRADLAWAVKRDAGLEGDGADGMAVCYYGTNSIASAKFIDFDGTDADLCRAIREARRHE